MFAIKNIDFPKSYTSFFKQFIRINQNNSEISGFEKNWSHFQKNNPISPILPTPFHTIIATLPLTQSSFLSASLNASKCMRCFSY